MKKIVLILGILISSLVFASGYGFEVEEAAGYDVSGGGIYDEFGINKVTGQTREYEQRQAQIREYERRRDAYLSTNPPATRMTMDPNWRDKAPRDMVDAYDRDIYIDDITGSGVPAKDDWRNNIDSNGNLIISPEIQADIDAFHRAIEEAE